MIRTTSVSFRGFKSTSEQVSRRMARNLKQGGRAERQLRSDLWRAGLRFRLHSAHLPGAPDIVLSRARICIFCDGDFWHGRDWPRLRRQLTRRHNSAYWLAKISSNRARDRRADVELRRAGWTVLRFWETDVLREPGRVAAEIFALAHNS